MRPKAPYVLGEHFDRFVEEQLKSGRYQSASEVLRASLRLLEAQELERDRIRAALHAGEDSGPAQPVDRTEFIRALRNRPANHA